MKIRLIALLAALLLLLAACAAPAPESESAPTPESASDPEPEPKDVSHFFMDGDVDSVEDQETAENLYWYLKGNLTPKDYCYIDLSYREVAPFVPDATSGYFLYIQGMDRSPVEALLREYDGPWVPIWFEETNRTFYDLMQAEEYIYAFFYKHPEFNMAAAVIQEGFVYVIADEITPELNAYMADFPIRCFFPSPSTDSLYGRGLNPD